MYTLNQSLKFLAVIFKDKKAAEFLGISACYYNRVKKGKLRPSAQLEFFIRAKVTEYVKAHEKTSIAQI